MLARGADCAIQRGSMGHGVATDFAHGVADGFVGFYGDALNAIRNPGDVVTDLWNGFRDPSPRLQFAVDTYLFHPFSAARYIRNAYRGGRDYGAYGVGAAVGGFAAAAASVAVVYVAVRTGQCVVQIAQSITGGVPANTQINQALKQLDQSGLRPGQTEISQSGIMRYYNNPASISRESGAVFRDGVQRFVVEGHHRTVANVMRGGTSFYHMPTSDPPSATNVYWYKEWWQIWRSAIELRP